MDWLRGATIASLLVVGILAGGTAVRMALVGGDLRVGTVLALVALFLLATVIRGARTRRWRQNPYW